MGAFSFFRFHLDRYLVSDHTKEQCRTKDQAADYGNDLLPKGRVCAVVGHHRSLLSVIPTLNAIPHTGPLNFCIPCIEREYRVADPWTDNQQGQCRAARDQIVPAKLVTSFRQIAGYP
jgi:hypothetical protein